MVTRPRAVILDLGRVIVPFEFRRAWTRAAEHSPLSPDEIGQRLKTSPLLPEFEMGRLAPLDFARRISTLCELSVSHDEFCELWNAIFLPETLIPDSLVARLAERGPLVLLSNTNAIHFEWLAPRYPILRHFHTLVLSYEVGAIKPDPAIYSRAVAATGCEPHECFFTDDMPEYVEGACRYGIDAVQFQGEQSLRKELTRREILP